MVDSQFGPVKLVVEMGKRSNVLNYTTPGRLGELSALAERLNFVLVIGDLDAA